MKTLLSSSVSYPMVVSSKSFLIKKMRLKFLSAVFFHSSTVSRRIFEFFPPCFLHCFFCSARRMGTNTTPEFGFGQDDDDDDDDDDVWANVDAR